MIRLNKNKIFLTTFIILSMFFFVLMTGNVLAVNVATCQTISAAGTYDVTQNLNSTGGNLLI